MKSLWNALYFIVVYGNKWFVILICKKYLYFFFFRQMFCGLTLWFECVAIDKSLSSVSIDCFDLICLYSFFLSYTDLICTIQGCIYEGAFDWLQLPRNFRQLIYIELCFIGCYMYVIKIITTFLLLTWRREGNTVETHTKFLIVVFNWLINWLFFLF